MTASILLAAYLIGSIPFAFLLARRRGVDLRRAGSGNIGATNVLRTSGVLLAVLAVALDGLKGALAVALAAAGIVFLMTVLATRIISVGSVSAAVTLAVATAMTDSSRVVVAGAWIASALIVHRHRGNLVRLLAGTERRVGGA
jgi:acyl phosphate:glycerol-3-phosphate acyltransferase